MALTQNSFALLRRFSIVAIGIVFIFAFADLSYECFLCFLHTSYWIVILFLLLILLSHLLARLAQAFIAITV